MKIIQPVRKKHSCTQEWKGTRETIFPLLCPVKERDWIPDWDPKLVISNSGVMEPECLFVESSTPADAIWVVSHYDPVNFDVAMYRILPGVVVGRFAITLDREVGTSTTARISYEQTALGSDGVQLVNDFTAEHFSAFMDEFALAINHYLSTGNRIDGNELMKREAAIHR